MWLPSSVQITYVWGHFASGKILYYVINSTTSASISYHTNYCPRLLLSLVSRISTRVLLPLSSSPPRFHSSSLFSCSGSSCIFGWLFSVSLQSRSNSLMITSLMLDDRKHVLAKNHNSQIANGARLSNLIIKHRENDLKPHS